MARRLLALAVLIPALSWSVPALAHKGLLDDMGCHKDRISTYYHCHEGELAGRKFAQKSGAQRALKKLHKKREEAAEQARKDEEAARVLAAAEKIEAAAAQPDAVIGYGATLVEVVEADTVMMDVAVWPGETRRVTVRLAGVSAPHGDGPDCARADAAAARGFAMGWLAGGGLSVADVAGEGEEVSGRVLKNGADLGRALVDAKLAREGGEAWCE